MYVALWYSSQAERSIICVETIVFEDSIRNKPSLFASLLHNQPSRDVISTNTWTICVILRLPVMPPALPRDKYHRNMKYDKGYIITKWKNASGWKIASARTISTNGVSLRASTRHSVPAEIQISKHCASHYTVMQSRIMRFRISFSQADLLVRSFVSIARVSISYKLPVTRAAISLVRLAEIDYWTSTLLM